MADDGGTGAGDDAVRRAIRTHFAHLGLQSPTGGKPLILIACSGGPDSLALAKAAAKESARGSWSAGAIIIDHGLQPGSAEVAAQAGALCRSFGLDPVEVVDVDIDHDRAGQGGPEAMARNARRAALLDAAERHGAQAICLAHTRDDQAETVLLRLARGSGARSLSAMSPVTGIWHRPLLGLHRATVHASLGDVRVWHDPHNVDRDFARVRVRCDALPALVDALGPAVVEGLARSAELLRDDADALDALADQMWSTCVSNDSGDGVVELDLGLLKDAHRAVRSRLLRRACLEVGAPAAAITFEHVRSVEALVSDWHGQGPLDLPGSLRVSRGCGRLRFDRSESLGSPPRA
jgi:tRNA(Ile)-lysidine synthase